MKHEWKKFEKNFYWPMVKPEQIVVPKFKFYTIQGEGDPNDEYFLNILGYCFHYLMQLK